MGHGLGFHLKTIYVLHVSLIISIYKAMASTDQRIILFEDSSIKPLVGSTYEFQTT